MAELEGGKRMLDVVEQKVVIGREGGGGSIEISAISRRQLIYIMLQL